MIRHIPRQASHLHCSWGLCKLAATSILPWLFQFFNFLSLPHILFSHTYKQISFHFYFIISYLFLSWCYTNFNFLLLSPHFYIDFYFTICPNYVSFFFSLHYILYGLAFTSPLFLLEWHAPIHFEHLLLPFCNGHTHSCSILCLHPLTIKVKQSCYRPGVAQRVSGIKVPRLYDNSTGWR